MMYFVNGRFIVDFNVIVKFFNELIEAIYEFQEAYWAYAVVGLVGFMTGVIWLALMNLKEKREQKKIEEKYQTSNI